MRPAFISLLYFVKKRGSRMRLKSFFWLLIGCSLLTGPVLWASDARVDATGGLSLVIDDDNYQAIPFIVGNPAGLALIPSKSRLDVSGNYFFENETADQFQRHYVGNVGTLDVNTVNYQGLILFPTDRWGVQLDADYLYTEGQAISGLNAQGNNRLRGLLRTAYDFGPFVLGAEFTPSQTTSPLSNQPLGGGQLVSGTDTNNSRTINGGLLACFPGDPRPQEDRFEIGGIYGNQLTPAQDVVDLNIVPTPSAAPIPITATFTDTNAQVFGPEIYFESPGSLQIAVVSRFAQFTSQLGESDPATVIQPYKTGDGSEMDLTGVFKSSSPLGRKLNFKAGGLVSFASQNQNSYNSTGSTTSTSTQQNLQAQVGAGIESIGDFTVGMQAALQTVSGSQVTPSGTDLGDTGYMAYSVAFGGERWLSKHWAFRMGLAYQNQFNNGNIPYTTFYFPAMDPDVRLISTIITLGLGFKDNGFYLDGELSYGEPTRDGGGPSDFATQVGTQLAAGVMFD